MDRWLLRVLYYNYYQKEKKLSPLNDKVEISRESREPDKEVLQNERNQILMQALDVLEKREKEILLLQYFEENVIESV